MYSSKKYYPYEDSQMSRGNKAGNYVNYKKREEDGEAVAGR